MAFTSYIIENDRRFKDALERARAACDDLRIPFSLILNDFYRSEQAIFKLQGPGQYPDFKNGGPESRYAKLKMKQVGFKYPLLFKTGKLAASLLGPKNEGSIATVRPLEMFFGTAVPYAIYHQSDEPRAKIPLRKFLFIGPEAPQFANSDQTGRPERWLNIMNDFVLKKVKKEAAFT